MSEPQFELRRVTNSVFDVFSEAERQEIVKAHKKKITIRCCIVVSLLVLSLMILAGGTVMYALDVIAGGAVCIPLGIDLYCFSIFLLIIQVIIPFIKIRTSGFRLKLFRKVYAERKIRPEIEGFTYSKYIETVAGFDYEHRLWYSYQNMSDENGTVKVYRMSDIVNARKDTDTHWGLGVHIYLSLKSQKKGEMLVEVLEKAIRNTKAMFNEANIKADEAIKEFKNIAIANSSITADEIPAPAPSENERIDSIELLKQYKQLLDSGVITREEFDSKKKQILGL